MPDRILCEISSKSIEKEADNNDITQIVCVKWGTRYNAEYVNKLYRGILRNTTKKFKFYCFTDDSSGLLPEVVVKELKEDWPRWWGKASLFSKGEN